MDATVPCPSCSTRVPVPPLFLSGQLACPGCRAVVDVRGEDDEFGELEEAPSIRMPQPGQAPLPPLRETEKSQAMHSQPIEDWVPHAPAPRSPGFIAKPAAAAGDAASAPEVRRKNWRKEKYGDELTHWEDKTHQSSRRIHRRERRLMRIMTGATLLLTAILAGVVIYNRMQDANRPLVAAPPPARPLPLSDAEIPLDLASQTDVVAEAWETVRKFATAQTPEEVLPYIRDRERVAPLLLAWYSTEHPWTPISIRNKPDADDIRTSGEFTVIEIELADFKRIPLALERTPGGFLVDWESYAGYCELSYPEIKAQRPAQPTLIRAVVTKGEFYSGIYASEQTHRCFKLTGPTGEHTLYGYVENGSALDVQMIQTMLNAKTLHMVLRVSCPPETSDRSQVDITEIVQKGWVIRPDDGAGWPAAPVKEESSLTPP